MNHTWGFPPDTASEWRSRRWPTSWSPPRCGTASPSCPTPRGWAWLPCGSETTLQSHHMYSWLCGQTLAVILFIHTHAWAGSNASVHAHTYTQTQTYFLKTHRTHTHSSSIPKWINTHFCTSIHNLKKRKHAVQPEEHSTSKVNDKYYILLQRLCDASKLG